MKRKSCVLTLIKLQFIPALAEFWRQGRFPIDRLTKSYSYKEVNQAIDDMNRGRTIKPILIWAD